MKEMRRMADSSGLSRNDAEGSGVAVIDREVDDVGAIQAGLDLSGFTEDHEVERRVPAPKSFWSRTTHWP